MKISQELMTFSCSGVRPPLSPKGKAGEAYNVANPDTFCTIREMAEMVVREFSNGKSKVVIDTSEAAACGYLPSFKMKLNVDKLKALGWEPRIDLITMYRELINGL